ncbi:MOSC domain-containing protein [Streptomyces erythrochromogenes]|uniref:MOSC domain-containing protein n=1 Tax=Streptomyces erythrochromogenes TaxID=285574 RepID=UPI0037F74CD4
MARVVNLIRCPVKGCAGTPVSDALMTPAGLAHDRSFMVVSENGLFRTQRRHPRLALIRPTISAGGTRLTLESADSTDAHGTVRLDVTTSAPRRDVDLFGTTFQGIDQGDDVAAWLSDVLGTPSRLVRVPPEHDRIADGLTPGPSGYADSSAVHLLSRATLTLLNRRMAERGAPPLPMNRFRPNIVLVAQDVGERQGPEPLRTLATYRRAASGGVVFGTKFSVITPGKLSVGDEVAVKEWGDTEP